MEKFIIYLEKNKFVLLMILYLKSLEVIIEESMIVLTYQGKLAILNNPNYFDEIEILSPSSLSLENYIYIGNDE